MCIKYSEKKASKCYQLTELKDISVVTKSVEQANSTTRIPNKLLHVIDLGRNSLGIGIGGG